MPLLDFLNFTWLRNLLGIRKDLIDTKKSKLEVEKLEDEKLARKFITTATMDDVKKYDSKYRKIRRKVEIEERRDKTLIELNRDFGDDRRSWWVRFFRGVGWQVLVLTLILALTIFIVWIMSFFNE